MRRSEINALMREAVAFLHQRQFFLPPFAYWTPEQWRAKGTEVSEIVQNGLGWDITDFGHGDYRACGLLLFTLRNGHPDNWRTLSGKLYAEKIMIVGVNQVTPMHFHWKKMEDIINRGGGNLMIQLYNADDEEELADTPVTVSVDGVRRTLPAGTTLTLSPGESITLTTHLYHKFWGEGSTVLVGEVSTVNDDTQDNRFYQPAGRFPSLEEDEAPLYLLVTDYTTYWRA